MAQFTQNDLFWLRQALEQAKAGLEEKVRLGNAGAHVISLTYLKLHEKVSQEIHANEASLKRSVRRETPRRSAPSGEASITHALEQGSSPSDINVEGWGRSWEKR